MKTKVLTVLTVTMICFLVTNMQHTFAQGFSPFERHPGYSASPPPTAPMNNGGGTSLVPQRATMTATCPICGAILWGGPGTPCPDCDESTEGKLPIGGGCWVLMGLAIAYGLFCRNSHNRVKSNIKPNTF